MPISTRTEWDLLSKTNHLNKQQIVLYKHIEGFKHIQWGFPKVLRNRNVLLQPPSHFPLRTLLSLGESSSLGCYSRCRFRFRIIPCCHLQEGEILLQVKLCEQGKMMWPRSPATLSPTLSPSQQPAWQWKWVKDFPSYFKMNIKILSQNPTE